MLRASGSGLSQLQCFGASCPQIFRRLMSSDPGRVVVTTSLPDLETRFGDDLHNPEATTSGRYEVQCLEAIPRGKRGLKRHREAGYLPGILFSMPGETNQPILLQAKAIRRLVNDIGAFGIKSRLFNLRLRENDSDEGTVYPVLAKNVHQTAGTFDLENVTFMYCPPDRIAKVEVPVKLTGEDIAPGVRKGGFISLTRKVVRCIARRSHIPSHFEVDVSQMDLAQKYYLDILDALPMGMAVKEKHEEAPICRMVGKAKAAAS